MNYPVWNVAFGAGLLMAVLAILHVFVSHFAVGGGLFLVLTERKARRNNDSALLEWLKTAYQVFCAGNGRVRCGQRRWHLVHHWPDQPYGHQQSDSRLRLGMGDRVGIFLRGNHGRAALPVWMGEAGAGAPRVVRMDLFHRCVRQHGDHQRHHHLYVDLWNLGSKSPVLERVL